jgi:chromosome partitioning protein
MAEKEKDLAKVFAVVNRKGGVAKTTTAINLAHGLSRKLLRRVEASQLDQLKESLGDISDTDRLFQYQSYYYFITGHVLLVDFDAQGHCVRGLGIEPGQADVGEVLSAHQHVSQAVISADRSPDGYPRPNFWLLPSSDNLEKAKEILRRHSYGRNIAQYGLLAGDSDMNRELLGVLQESLGLAVERFSYIILDCPPALDAFTQAVYRFSDAAIVPVKADYFSMAGTDLHLANIQEAQLRGIDIRIHTIVPTFYVHRQRLDQQMLASLKTTYGDRVSEPIPRSQAVAEAPAYGQTIFEMDPRYQNPATLAYQALVDRVFYG